MTTRVFLWLIGTVLAGLILVFLGYRGRRINRKPSCRQCGFDLSGVLPAGVTCPECGAGIKLAKYVRMGQRKRMYSLIVLGLPAIFLPWLPLGAIFFTTITRTDLTKYKPFALLLWEAANLGEQDLKLVGNELFSRQVNGKLTGAEYDRLLEAAMTIQEDPGRPWLTEWSQIVNQAMLDKKLGGDKLREFQTRAALVNWATRPVAHPGGRIPLIGKLKETRATQGTQAQLWYFLEKAEIDGKTVVDRKAPTADPSQSWYGFLSGEAYSQNLYIDGSMQSSNVWYAMTQDISFSTKLPEDLPPGTHQLELSLAVSAQAMQMDGSSKPTPPHWIRTTKVLTIEIIPKDKPLIELIPASESAGKEIAEQLAPTASAWMFESAGSVQLSFNRDAVKTPFSFKVAFRKGDRYVTIGRINSGKSLIQQGSSWYGYGRNGGGMVEIMGQIPAAFTNTEVDLILTPDADHAMKTLDVTRIYAGEIVIPGFRIEAQQDARRTTTTFPSNINILGDPVDPAMGNGIGADDVTTGPPTSPNPFADPE